jgi:hypothetical protein
MSGFTADESASRAGLAAFAGDTQSADSTVPASGDVLLTAHTADSSANGNASDSELSGAEHGSAAAPIVITDSEAPALTGALSSDVSDDTGSGFHLPATADAFWFTHDDSGSVDIIADGPGSAEDQGASVAVVASPAGSGTELELMVQPGGLFHDAGAAADRSGSVDIGYLGSSSSAALSNTVGPTVAAGSDGVLIISAPVVAESSSPSGGSIPNWIAEGSGTGGTSGGAGGTAGTSLISNQSSGGLVINVVYDASVANAPAGFTADVQSVVNYFESHFSNPVTITIDVGYGEVDGSSLGSGALGESITYFDPVSYAQLHSTLAANLNANGNSAAAATLPATSPVSGQWWVSTAEAEALGITSASNNPDGYVGFSSTANIFAYNDTNGVPSNQYDFTAVVAHEISEVMGRQMFDGTNAFGTGASYDPLDLFHYSASGVRDFTGYTGYASADGGKTSLDAFNTIRGGDLADWASSAGNDAFDAFSNPGVVNAVTASDLTELNLLGWDPLASTPPTTPVVTVRLASDTGWSSTMASRPRTL